MCIGYCIFQQRTKQHRPLGLGDSIFSSAQNSTGLWALVTAFLVVYNTPQSLQPNYTLILNLWTVNIQHSAAKWTRITAFHRAVPKRANVHSQLTHATAKFTAQHSAATQIEQATSCRQAIALSKRRNSNSASAALNAKHKGGVAHHRSAQGALHQLAGASAAKHVTAWQDCVDTHAVIVAHLASWEKVPTT